MKNYILILLLFLLVAFCSRKYENPIDPELERPLPPIPVNLTAYGATHKSITLSFEYNYENAIGIIIYRNDQPIDSLYGGENYIDSAGLEFLTVYRYNIFAYNENGLSEMSNTVFDTTLSQPDTTAPLLTIISPTDSIVSESNSIRFSGVIVDTISGVSSVYYGSSSDTAVLTDSTWYFDLAIDIQLHGQYRSVLITGEDSAGNITQMLRYFKWDSTIIDTTPPVIEVVVPDTGYLNTGLENIMVKVLVRDDISSVSYVKINGLNAGAESDSIWSKLVEISQVHLDTTQVLVTTSDNSINRNCDTSYYYMIFDSSLSVRDRDGPEIEILYNSQTVDDTLIVNKDSTILLEGVVNDTSGVDSFWVTINSAFLQSFTALSWTHQFNLGNYTNEIVFHASDSLGNVSEKTVLVYCDFPESKPKFWCYKNGTGIMCDWSKSVSPDFSKYILWASLDKNIDIRLDPETTLASITDTTFLFNPESNEVTYYFRVVEEDSAGNRTLSSLGMMCYNNLYGNIEMVTIPPGFFVSSGWGDTAYISSDFEITATEVTQFEYVSLMGYDSSRFPGADKPTTVTWKEAVLFCNEKSKADGYDTLYTFDGNKTICDWGKYGYRLPTEDEWEHARRAGSKTKFHWGDDPVEAIHYEWHDANFGDSVEVVGQLRPSRWGLYDMSGNVREWCWNHELRAFPTNGRVDWHGGDGTEEFRIAGMGGFWDANSVDGLRNGNTGNYPAIWTIGFRVVLRSP